MLALSLWSSAAPVDAAPGVHAVAAAHVLRDHQRAGNGQGDGSGGSGGGNSQGDGTGGGSGDNGQGNGVRVATVTTGAPAPVDPTPVLAPRTATVAPHAVTRTATSTAQAPAPAASRSAGQGSGNQGGNGNGNGNGNDQGNWTENGNGNEQGNENGNGGGGASTSGGGSKSGGGSGAAVIPSRRPRPIPAIAPSGLGGQIVLAATGPGLGALPSGATSLPVIGTSLAAATRPSDAVATPTGGGGAVVIAVPRAHHSGASALQAIVDVIPTGVWWALGGAIAFGALMAAVAVFVAWRMRRQTKRFSAVATAAVTDPLTAVLNRRGFTDAVEHELARAARYGREFALAYVDVRGLKAVNDSQGHKAGDRLLKEVADILTSSARRDDVVGRIGGDELALVLIEQSAEGAAAVIARIRAEVATRRPKIGIKAPWDLTVGVAQFPEDATTVDGLMQVADRRLYEQRGIALS